MASCIPLQTDEAEVVGQCATALHTAVYSKFGCTTILHGINYNSLDSNTAKKSKFIREKKYSIRLPFGLNISVWKDDLTTHEVDAVVNAANEDLQHIGGLALALSKAGGPIIQKESDEIQKKGKVYAGKAVVTSAGILPCRKIIHAVGPHVRPNADRREIDQASKYLSEAIDSILKIAELEKLLSVAIPAISSGLFNFPLDRCANIIVNTLKKYDYSVNKNKVLDVRLVNHDDPTVSEIVRACKEILEVPKTSYSGAVSASGYSSIKDLPPVKLGKVTLHITQGHIEKQKTSVIVNTTAPELDLSNGAVTRAILSEAGHKLQEDVRKFRGTCKWGDVLKTSGHNLHARHVYHVLCLHKGSSGPKAAEQILSDVISECLHKAEVDRCPSIAFPAIGCGVLKFSKHEAADIMITAMKHFSSSYQGRPMDIHIVIFPTEKETFQAFAERHARLQQSVKSHPSNSGSSQHEQMKDAPTPAIEIQANFPEAFHAAKRWINDVLDILRNSSAVYNIKNNQVLHFGQHQYKELLSIQHNLKVGLQVSFTGGQAGQACITIMGSPADVTAAVLEVEAMISKVQEAHAREEEASMLYSLVRWRCKHCPKMENPEINAALEKAYLAGNKNYTIDPDTRVDLTLMEVATKHPAAKYQIERVCFFKHYRIYAGLPGKSYFTRQPRELSSEQRMFQSAGLQVVRAEIVENYALRQLFELSRKRIPGSPKRLYQRVPAQCVELVSRVGFQRDYAPPDVQNYGEGIYFTRSVKSAMELWKEPKTEEYVYIIEAEVLTGNDTRGSPEHIIPPPRGNDPLIRYDSLTAGHKDTILIFNGYQAQPLHIYTCKNEGTRV